MWDFCGGIGCNLLSACRANLRLGSYDLVEINPRASGVLRANLPYIRQDFPASVPAPEVLACFGERLPTDLLELERTIANILRELKDDELPTLFNITAPCVEGSYAGPGNGACASRGRVFLAGLAVIGRVIDEYKRRGVLPPHGNAPFAPCGWLFETAPLRHGDARPGVEELRLLYGTTMGAAAVDDAAFKGSAAHRSTQMYTNLGAADDWVDISTRGQREPRVPLERILRPGEYLQRWDESKLGPARPPSVAGQPPRRYPKIVRSLGSYAWRAQQLSAAQLAADARKPLHVLRTAARIWSFLPRGLPSCPFE